MRDANRAAHAAEHAGATRGRLLQPPAFDLIRVGSRRWFLQTGLAGLAGLSLPQLLRCRAQAGATGAGRKAVILIWLSGGPSHLDTWDPKPSAPVEQPRAPSRPLPPACRASASVNTCRVRPGSWTVSP